ncbi:MAG: hypothetical protein ACYDAI_02515 [Trichloromonadaceae bacterium]
MSHITRVEVFESLATLLFYEPEDLPEWGEKKLKPLLTTKAINLVRRYEGKIQTVTDARALLEEWSKIVSEEIVDMGLGHQRVKAGKGKTEASRKITIEIFKNHYLGDGQNDGAPPERSEVHFFAPASMIYTDPQGQDWLSDYFVRQKLAEKSKRAWYKKDSYQRTPCHKPEWAHRESFLELHLHQIPAQEAVDSHLERRAAEKREQLERLAAEREAERLAWEAGAPAREVAAAARAVAKAKAEARTALAREKMEKHEGVNVRWFEWEQRKNGKYKTRVKVEEAAENVTLRISGDRTYIVFSNGAEIMKKSSNVEILKNEE